MAEVYLSIHVHESALDEIRNRTKYSPDFMERALNLGFLIDNGVIYQKISGQLIQVSISDITPLPGPDNSSKTIESLNIQIDPDWESAIIHKPNSFADWFSRVLALRLRAENVPLYRRNNNEFEKINFG